MASLRSIIHIRENRPNRRSSAFYSYKWLVCFPNLNSQIPIQTFPMHRQPLLTMLKRYTERYPDEADVAQRIERLVVDHADCFERTCRPGHITGSAWVLSHDRSESLLLHHGKLHRWLQPGGHADGQTDVAQVALREAQEETGLVDLQLSTEPLDIDVHAIPARVDRDGNQTEDAHEHHDIRFLLIAAANQEPILSDESHAVRWFSRKQLLEVTDEESVLRMLRKAGPR
jgi:8-oxo-dGTP pyrophosphatase MutT (NUDIX family)